MTVLTADTLTTAGLTFLAMDLNDSCISLSPFDATLWPTADGELITSRTSNITYIKAVLGREKLFKLIPFLVSCFVRHALNLLMSTPSRQYGFHRSKQTDMNDSVREAPEVRHNRVEDRGKHPIFLTRLW
jgi:hypothetical protein